ncbi:MAG: hypothetical protein MUE51_13705 [Thermoleophilia bacterium]|nr:hypothetical protein [Thermoleophilia bacterium]
MTPRTFRRALLGAAALGLAAGAAGAAAAPAAFAPRVSVNANGDIAIAGNTLLTCPPAVAGCLAGREGSGPDLDNNDFAMQFVDVDADPATSASSRAALALPPGAEVLSALLYVGVDESGDVTQARITAPGGAPQAIGGTLVGSVPPDVQARFDVTAIVRAAGAGTYTVGTSAATAAQDKHAGWALVVTYRDPAAPLRNLTVFDGFQRVQSGSPLAIPLSGFVTPAAGPVRARVGVVTYEGDLGITGDSLQFAGSPLSGPLNPATNPFNSTVSVLGQPAAGRDPAYANTFGTDVDLFAADGLLANGASSAQVGLGSTGDVYYPGVVTTAIDLFAPAIALSLAGADLDGGALVAGDVIEYTATAANTGGDTATGLTHPHGVGLGVLRRPDARGGPDGHRHRRRARRGRPRGAPAAAGVAAGRLRSGPGAAPGRHQRPADAARRPHRAGDRARGQHRSVRRPRCPGADPGAAGGHAGADPRRRAERRGPARPPGRGRAGGAHPGAARRRRAHRHGRPAAAHHREERRGRGARVRRRPGRPARAGHAARAGRGRRVRAGVPHRGPEPGRAVM